MTPEIKDRLKHIFNTVAKAVEITSDFKTYKKDGKSYSPMEVAREVEQETEFGRGLMEGVWKISQEINVPVSAIVVQMFKKN